MQKVAKGGFLPHLKRKEGVRVPALAAKITFIPSHLSRNPAPYILM
jgi:hypothetical protein